MTIAEEGNAVSPQDGEAVARQGQIAPVTLAYVVTGLIALTIGVFFGPLQALNYGGVETYRAMEPSVQSYYQGLTLHGVMNAYAFTTFFMSGLMYYLTARELEETPSAVASWFWYGIMLLGLVLTLGAIAANEATVLYTWYAPMLADGAFYIGIALIFVASWGVGYQILSMRARWKQANPGRITPLVTWMSVVTMIMWFLASLGAVAAAVIWHIPAALGWIDGVPPMITRTLFWWTGHPIVYFWLMPAYISWYALIPRQVGGVLISDPLARVSFILLMLFSLPVGTHHQLMDAGIPDVMRAIVVFLTFTVILPSLLTAFTVGASLEYAGRRRGGRGLLGWFFKLPWGDPSVAAQLLAMLLFIFGGASGLVNGSWALNAVIHNTTWVPGHFHATLASASALTFFGISFWLLPNLTGKPLASRKVALWGTWLWFIGMLIFSNAMMIAGLQGVPRRAWIKRVFDLVKDFGTSQSPKSTRSSTAIMAPAALRPLPCATPRWFAAQDNSHKWLDAAFGYSLCFPSGALRARPVNSLASRLPGTTRLRFALPGGQRSGMTAGGGYDTFYANAHWSLFAVGVSGVILAVAAVLIFGVLYATLLRPRGVSANVPTVPFSDAFRTKRSIQLIRVFDNMLLWTLVSIVLVAAVYGPVLWAERVMNVPLPGIRVW